MRFHRFLLVLFGLVLAVASSAQKLLEESLEKESSYTIQYWKTEEGLPQNSVLSVTQAKSGAIWLLTYSGISYFDGRQFYTFNETNVPGLKGRLLTGLGTDVSGNTLVYTNNGTFRFDESTRRFSEWRIGNLSIVADAIDTEGNVYQATSSGSVYRQRKGGKAAELFRLNSTVNSMVSLQGKLLIASDKGLFSFYNGSLRRVILGNDLNEECSFLVRKSMYPGLKKSSTRCVAQLTVVGEDKICLYRNCDSKHVYYYSVGSGLIEELPIDIGNSNIQYISFDKIRKQLWIATDKGLYSGEEKNRTVTKNPYLNDQCYALKFDLENNLWVGTKQGLYLIKPKLFHTYGRKDGLTPDGIAGLLETKPAEMLVANSDCGGLFVLKNGEISKSQFPQLSSMCVWSLFKTVNHDIYVGGGYGMLFRIRGNSCNRIQLPKECSDASVLCMFEDGSGQLWIGTEAGLFIKDNNDLVTRFKGFNVNGMVIQIFKDSKKRIWLGTSTQIAVFENGTWKDLSSQTGLEVNYIRAFYEDRDRNLWIGSRGEGLLKYSDNQFTSYESLGKMLDKDVWSIVEDNFGYLWMSSNQGITVAKREDLIDLSDGRSAFVTIKHFDRTDGMQSSEFNGGFMPAVLKAHDGRLWFPGAKGLSVVDPAKVDFTPFSIPLTIEKLVIDGQEIDIEGKTEYRTAINPGRIQIFYNAPVFGHKKDVVFQSGLDGYDDNWTDPTLERLKDYRNLPPGSYKFRVKLYGNYKKEINQEASFTLIVPGPIWKNPTFISALAIIVIVVAIVLSVWRVRNIRQKTEEQQKLQKQFAALELKALQSQMNPHFIFNCLNSIKYFISVHDEVSAGKYLQSFSRLLRKFLEQSDSSSVSLRDEMELLKLYMDLQQMRFTHKFLYEFHTGEIGNADQISIPTMLLQPFVENAIIHGLMPLQDPGKLIITFSIKDGILNCEIKDEGVGRAESAKKRKSGNRSMGTSITESRIQLINYFNGNGISVETFDTYTDGRTFTGTTVRILIPLNTENNA